MHRHSLRLMVSIVRYCLMVTALCLMGATAYAQPSFSKSFVLDTIGPGSQSILTFQITNGDPVNPVTDLAFTDNLPAGMTIATPPAIFTNCVNGLVSASAGGSTISFSEGRLSTSTSCVVQVNVTSSNPGTMTNVSGDLTSSAGNSGTATADLTVVTNRPGFSKSFAPSTVNFRERSTLTFTVDNTANASNIFNIAFTDVFPIGIEVAGPANASTTCTGGVINAQPGAGSISYAAAFTGDASLAAAASCTLSVDVLATAVGLLGNVTGELNSIVLPSPFTVSSGRAGAQLQVNADDELIFSKAFTDDPAIPGGMVMLEFRIQNPDRNFPATNIAFTDDLDATLTGLTAIGLPINDICGAGSQINGGSLLTFTGGSLPPDSLCVFSVPLQVPAGAVVGGFPNITSQITADVAGNMITGNPAAETLFINEAPLLTKTFLSNPVGAGESVTMEFSITNISTTSAATDIAFMDEVETFLPGFILEALPAAGFCGAGSFIFITDIFGIDTLTLIGANLAAGDSCTFTLDFMVPAGTSNGTFTNTTTPITATVDGITQVGNPASDTLQVLQAPRLEKEFTDDPVFPGDTVTLEFTIVHAADAPTDATNISFTDDLNATLAGLAATGLPMNDVCGIGSQISGTTNLSFTGGTLVPGGSCTFNVTLQVPVAALPGVFTNSTSNLTATVSGVAVTGLPDSDELVITGLELTKEFIDDPVIAGDTVTLRFSIDNSSPSNDATGIFFTDNLSSVVPGLVAIAPLPVNPCGAGSVITGTSFLILVGGNLTANTSCSFDLTLQVPAGAADDSYVNNTSSMTATVAGSVIVLPPASDSLTVNSSVLQLSKTFTDDPVTSGDTVSLEFTLTNQSAVNSITGISFTDDLGAVLAGLAAVGLPSNDVCGAGSQISGAGLVTLTGGSLSAGGSCTFSLTLQVPANSPPGSFLNTTGQVTGTASGLPVTGAPASDTLTVLNVDFTKSFSNPVVTGNQTTLSFTIQNNGTSTIQSLSFSDDLDAVVSGMIVTGLPAGPVCGENSTLTGSSIIVLTAGSLAGGASCSFDLTVLVPLAAMPGTFINTTSELFAAGLTVAEPAVADIVVMGIPALTVMPVLTDFGDQVLGTTSGNMQVTLENTGTDVLDVSTITFAAAPFNFISTTCGNLPFSLAVNTSCTVTYSFSPTTLGPATQMFTVESNGVTSPDNFTLQGNGVQPAISISPTLVDFGDQLINTSSIVMSSTLQNTGTADLNVSSITAAAAPFVLVGGSCAGAPFSLVPNASCTLNYTFSPTVAGAAMQNLTLVSDAPTNPDTLTLQGNGTQAGLGLSATMLDFGDINLNNTVTMPLILTNTGDGPLTVTAIGDPLAPFTIASGTCGGAPFSLQPAAQCQLDISFMPVALGNFDVMFDITSNAPSNPDMVQLLGNGVLPQLVLDVTDIDFDIVIVGATETLPLTLTNAGDGNLVITDITDPLQPFAVLPGSCGPLPISLMSGQQCQLDISFRPRSNGEFTAGFDIISNAPDSPAVVNLRGIGLLVEVPALSLWSLMVLIMTVLLVSAYSLHRSGMQRS